MGHMTYHELPGHLTRAVELVVDVGTHDVRGAVDMRTTAMSTTSDAVVYNPYAYEIHEDPYPTYERLRDEAPLYRNEEMGFWALSRHADVLEGFRDFERFSNAHGVSLDPAASGPHAHRTMSFLAMDPPMHGRMRGLVSRGFTPRRVAELEPRIRRIARDYIADMIEKGSVDFIADFAGRLPMDVISEMMGVPVADREELRRLSDLLVHREPGVHDVPPEGMAAALDAGRLLRRHARPAARRARPTTSPRRCSPPRSTATG